MFKKSNPGKKTNLSQFGLLDIPDLDDGDEPMDLSDDDMDLEAELAAISGGGGAKRKPRKPAPVPSADLDAMIAASLKDVPSDDEGSGDDDDPDLLNELQELGLDDEEPPVAPRVSRTAPPPPSASAESSVISLLQDRITNYTQAEKVAKESGESGRARRFGRGLKTLNDLLKQAKAGKPVNDEDIPPPVSVGKPAGDNPPPSILSPSVPPPSLPPPLIPRRVAPSVPEPTAPEPSAPAETEEPPSLPEPDHPPPPPPRTESQGIDPSKLPGLQMILKRKEEFKAAALSAKHAGDKAMALEYLKVVKQFDIVVEAYRSGQEMDLSELPTPEGMAAALRSEQKSEDQTQHASEPQPPETAAQAPALIMATTVDEALRQRLAAFQEQESKAKEEGNTSKARRMGRIVKQYQDAVRAHAAGRPVPLDELPVPSGYGPLPSEGSSVGQPQPSPSTPAAEPRPTPPPARAARPAGKYEKQLALLLHRQKEFKEAALSAKKAGKMEQAKEYLRAAKGFDTVIEAARGGLAVDLASLPPPPARRQQLEHTFDVVSAEDCEPPVEEAISAEDEDLLGRLQGQLSAQLRLCAANRDHYRAVGNVAESNRFENLALRVKQDLDLLAVAKSLNKNPPKFHYETKQFSVVQCNTDLNENDLELTIVRGIAYNVPNPKEVDTYVKFEFPYPPETPVSERTALVKDTNSPQYDAAFPLAIQRANRGCLRVFKRHALKCYVYSRGGWFSKDTLLGTVAVKLAPLETQVTIHEAFPLMDGRRPAGGSLEVKLRVRTPLLQQQVETTTHRWLVIDT